MNKGKYDVICIGGGGAGVTAAVTAVSLGARVALVTKDLVGYGNTRISGGRTLIPGIAQGDSSEALLNDMMVSGEFLNRKDVAELFATEGSQGVPIVESFGHIFARDKDGGLKGKLKRGAGSTIARTVVSATGGIGMGHALRAAVARLEVDLLEETIVTKILVKDHQVEGVCCIRLADGAVFVLVSKVVIIATGGLGWLFFPHTHQMRTATGDGYGLALKAGAELIDMEMVQFRSYSITHPEHMIGIACNPSVGRLLNNRGEVILELENSEKMSADEPARIVALEIGKGGGSQFGGLTVDFSKYDTPEGQEALKKLKEDEAVKKAYGEKASQRKEPWDVAPCAKSHLGGIKIDQSCQSSVGGLLAAGEAMGGLHGASRLTDSELAEIYVFGRTAGYSAAQFAQRTSGNFRAGDEAEKELARVRQLFGSAGHKRPIILKRRLQKVMWEAAGPVRTEEKLRAALREIDEIKKASGSLTVSGITRYNLEMMDAIELPLMLSTAETIIISALERKESRGSHFRLDFPDMDDENWLRNIIVWEEDDQIQVRTEKTSRSYY